MGTNSTKDLQDEIKNLIKRMGWSQKKLGKEIYISNNDLDNADEMRQMEERVKKSLSRPSTHPEVLKRYLQVILNHSDFEKRQLVSTCYVSINELDKQLESEMLKISKLVSKKIHTGSEEC